MKIKMYIYFVILSGVLPLLCANAVAKNQFETAFQNIEKKLCRVVNAKGCSPTNIKRTAKTKSEKPKTLAPIAPVITEKPKPPIPRKKPVAAEVKLPEAVIVTLQEDIPPEPIVTQAPEPTPPEPVILVSPPSIPKAIKPLTKTAMLPPVFLPPPALPSDAAVCQADLAKLNVTFIASSAYGEKGNCVIANPVQLKSYTSNGVKLEFPDQPILNCAFALHFINFIHESAEPLIVKQTSQHIAKLYTGPGFVCRGRNGDISSKLSEHAMGNAVDIERIQLTDGHIVLVKDALSELNKDYAVLNTIRQAACTYFTTVLGPGANAAHASHFHFDLGQHGKSGTYRICQ